jgi:hypothetical protein
MAVTPTITEVKPYKEKTHIIAWASIANSDNGVAIEMPGSSLRSIQFGGTFGVGGTIVLEGSNDGVTYFTLTDPQGNSISKTSASLEAVQELTRYVRPRVTAGDGTTALNATLLVRRPE